MCGAYGKVCLPVVIIFVLKGKSISHWLNQGHVDKFKTNVLWLVNISKIVDQPVNICFER